MNIKELQEVVHFMDRVGQRYAVLMNPETLHSVKESIRRDERGCIPPGPLPDGYARSAGCLFMPNVGRWVLVHTSKLVPVGSVFMVPHDAVF